MNAAPTVRALPAEERPRERLVKYGVEALSSTELLAILLGSGTRGKSVIMLAQELLAFFGTLEAISEATVEELCQLRGLGRAKAFQLKASFALGVRAAALPFCERPKVLSPRGAYEAVKKTFEGCKSELFAVVMIDVKGHLIGVEVISQGSVSEATVHPRELFYPAIRHKASSLIIAHNHPSGDLTPSKEDFAVTEALIAAGQLMGIPLNDHLIVNKSGYLSLRECGVQFFQSGGQ